MRLNVGSMKRAALKEVGAIEDERARSTANRGREPRVERGTMDEGDWRVVKAGWRRAQFSIGRIPDSDRAFPACGARTHLHHPESPACSSPTRRRSRTMDIASFKIWSRPTSRTVGGVLLRSRRPAQFALVRTGRLPQRGASAYDLRTPSDCGSPTRRTPDD